MSAGTPHAEDRNIRANLGPEETRSRAVSPNATSADVELANVQNGRPKETTGGEDLMQYARLGDIGSIQKLFENKRFDARYKDEEGITPLHWAAINNQYAVCKYLIESGADVNARGGESVATPAMWAAQRCHYYVVNLLLHNGADPGLLDSQGFNILHLSTIDGNAFILMLLLHQDIPVDSTDPQGHTSLMWAAYKGVPACVDLLLRWGANVNLQDEKGLTALHWALVRGSQPCIQKLLEYGADRSAQTHEGKTPSTVAGEMKSVLVYHKALDELGYDEDGSPKTLPFGLTSITRNKSIMSKLLFLWPFLTIFVIITILARMVVFAAVPIALVTAMSMQWVAQQACRWSVLDFRALHRTPYLSGIFAGSLFWVGVRWVATILPYTFASKPMSNVFFAAFFGLTTYFYVLAFTEDPGFVPKMSSRRQQKAVVDELFGLWKFDENNFCMHCMIRKPLRSKHCRRCNRCVAKHDHHCPWLNNCVAANNHRHFFLYILCMEAGVLIFIRLVLAYVYMLPAPEPASCNILNDTLCSIVLRDSWTWVLTAWATLQLTWVTMLLIVQLVQISRNQTTFENMTRHSIEHSLPNPSSRALTSAVTTGSTSFEAGGLSSTGMGPNPVAANPRPGRRRKEGCLAQWKKLLGLDAFMATASDGLADGGRQRSRQNVFSRGVITNCKDFFCDPSPYFSVRSSGNGMLGGEIINYSQLYDVPLRTRAGRTGGMMYRSVAGDDPHGEDAV